MSKYEPDKSKPQLAFTRKHGWVVVKRDLSRQTAAEYWYTRPNGHPIWVEEILAFAPLPPVPDEAL